jgi:hypothetical protein
MLLLENEILQFLHNPVEERFEPLALKIFEFQRERNPIYAQYCDSLGVEVDSWKRIPAVPQQAFKRTELRSFPSEATTFEFRTSGTTEEGYGRHFFPSLDLYQAAVQFGWEFFRLPRNPFALLMQSPEDAPFSSLSRMGSFLTAGQRDRFFITKDGVLEIDRLQKFIDSVNGPITLFGTALAFLNLLSTKLPLPPGSILMETGGFKGSGREIAKEVLYQQLSESFGIPVSAIWNEYGMTELSSQFYSSGIGNSHHGPPWLRLVVINPDTNEEAETGQVGLLKIIDLANLWSVLAIQTQDLAVAQPDGGFILLGRDPKALPRGCSRAMDDLLRRSQELGLSAVAAARAEVRSHE